MLMIDYQLIISFVICEVTATISHLQTTVDLVSQWAYHHYFLGIIFDSTLSIIIDLEEVS